MNEHEAGRYWNNNADAWTTLARAGHDLYRDHLNTPAFFAELPDINGLSGIDIGCGEGHNTRLLAARGAKLTGIDISEVFIGHAQQTSPGISYQVASATQLPFDDEQFHFATSFMCLMDIPDPAAAIREICRVLQPGGFLQFSITHPCFGAPHRKNLRNANGDTYAIEVGDYFRYLDGEIEEWIFGDTPAGLKQQLPKFKVPVFNYTLSYWINTIITAGFTIEALHEPHPSNETVRRYPALQDAQVVAYFLHIRCRKPLPSR